MFEPVRSIMTPKSRLTAVRIGNATAVLYRLDSNMRMRGVGMFLFVGHHEGITVSELAKHFGVRKNIASRYLSDLSIVDRNGKPGLGLITLVQRVHGDRRVRHVHLTERGREVIDEMHLACIEPRPRARF